MKNKKKEILKILSKYNVEAPKKVIDSLEKELDLKDIEENIKIFTGAYDEK